MKKKLLSICILTYNRAEYLAVCLESIVSQFHANPLLTEDVEVVISDDNSKDNTADVVARFKAEHKNIKYFKNEENLGFDGNVLAVLSRASGQYCWLFSDDDALAPGSLEYVIERIKENPEAGFIYVNSEAYEQDLETSLAKFGVNRPETALVDSADEFILEYNIPGFLSSLAFRRELWDSVDPAPYIDNLWMQTSVILEFLPKTKSLYIGKPFVLARDDSRWTKGGKNMLTFLNLKQIISNLVNLGYEKSRIKKIERAFAKDLVSVALDARRKGLGVNFKYMGRVIREFYQFPLMMLGGLFWLVLPGWLIKVGRKIKSNLFLSKQYKSD